MNFERGLKHASSKLSLERHFKPKFDLDQNFQLNFQMGNSNNFINLLKLKMFCQNSSFSIIATIRNPIGLTLSLSKSESSFM